MKKVIIIGATSGIGLEVAKIYAQKGWLVGATGRRLELLESLKNAFPENVEIQKHDVTASDNLLKINELCERMGGCDVFIYNSGVGIYNRELDFAPEKQTIDVNVTGFVESIGWGYRFLKKNGGGSLVGVSSVAGARGHFRAPAYNASKAFLWSYLEGLAAKSAKEKAGIRVTDIRPGFVETPMTEGNKGMFWVASAEKAARQIVESIEKGHRVAYVTRRWRLAKWILQALPSWAYQTI